MDEPINIKDILRTIEAGFGKNLRTTEARFDFTGPYKKTSVYRGSPWRNTKKYTSRQAECSFVQQSVSISTVVRL